jgi:hypothetical protein
MNDDAGNPCNRSTVGAPRRLVDFGHQLFVICAAVEQLRVLGLFRHMLGFFSKEVIGLSEERNTKLYILLEI